MLGQRIQRARKALGLSLRDLANQIALSHAAIKKYEDEVVIPSSDILIKLAKALHVRVEYFFRPEYLTLANIQYRKHKDFPDRHLEEITAKILEQIERRIELENLFPITPIKPFSLRQEKISNLDDIEAVANSIREQWNLGADPLLDLIDIFEEHSIKVFEINNQRYPKFDGLCAQINNMPIIVIGNQWPGDRQRFTLAHELAHLIFNNSLSSLLDEEKCCDRFAGAFLLPKESIINVLGKHRRHLEPRELELLKQEFGISMLAVLHRAEDLGIVSNRIYRQIRAEFDERGWSKHEPGEQYRQERTHIFEQMVFRALAEEYIGESKAAELMNMELDSFRMLRMMESKMVGKDKLFN